MLDVMMRGNDVVCHDDVDVMMRGNDVGCNVVECNEIV